MNVRLEYKLQDMWVGLYWVTEVAAVDEWIVLPIQSWRPIRTHLYICLVPCLPIHIWWNR